MERLLDRVAHELALDRAEVRRRNLIPPEKMPYTKPLKARSGMAVQYDTGDYPASQAAVLAAAGWDGFPARQARAHAGPIHRHRLAHGVKGTGRGPFESGLVRIAPSGRITIFTGAAAIGQGLHTALAQICAEQLGVRPQDVTVVAGDTAGVPLGLGAFASRQTVTAGSSVLLAARAVAAKARKVASHMLEAAEHDLEIPTARSAWSARRSSRSGSARSPASCWARPATGFRPGRARARSERELPHRCARLRQQLPCGGSRGRHRDRGRAHPALLGAAGFRHLDQPDDRRRPGGGRHRARHRQRVLRVDGLRRRGPAGDHHVRRLPDADRDRCAGDGDDLRQTPSPLNPLGAKGIGEAGTIPAAAALISAVEDALTPFGVHIADTPITPPRLRQLIAEAMKRISGRATVIVRRPRAHLASSKSEFDARPSKDERPGRSPFEARRAQSASRASG